MDTDGIGLRARVLLVVAGVVLALVGPLPTRVDAAAPAVRFDDGHGISVVSVDRRSAREYRLVVATAALEKPVRVNVVLPAGYASGTRRYPVAYVLHGTSGGADDPLDQGHVADAARDLAMIVVSPDGGFDGDGGGFFTDWVDQSTPKGATRWETFHVDQLVPWIDANLRTVADRSGRAVAGISQGGFGASSYAARHPDLFVANANLSGPPDLFRDPRARVLGTALVAGITTGLNGVQPTAPFGDPVTREASWAGHNPASLLTNLRWTDVTLYCGTGTPGPYDDPADPTFAAGAAIEVGAAESQRYFLRQARADGVAVHDRRYASGTHRWEYWARDLRDWLPRLQWVFDQRRPAPAVVGYRSVERTWSQWGWRVANDRPLDQAWSALSEASRTGFTFTGRAADVRTLASYVPGRRYRLTWTGGTGGEDRPASAVAAADGRLTIPVATGRARGVVSVRIG